MEPWGCWPVLNLELQTVATSIPHSPRKVDGPFRGRRRRRGTSKILRGTSTLSGASCTLAELYMAMICLLSCLPSAAQAQIACIQCLCNPVTLLHCPFVCAYQKPKSPRGIINPPLPCCQSSSLSFVYSAAPPFRASDALPRAKWSSHHLDPSPHTPAVSLAAC